MVIGGVALVVDGSIEHYIALSHGYWGSGFGGGWIYRKYVDMMKVLVQTLAQTVSLFFLVV